MRERIVRAVAGTIVLTSILLAFFVDVKWLFLTSFVGVNLLQSSFTKFCPLEKVLDKMNIKEDRKRANPYKIRSRQGDLL
jgi:hypothetical protein